MGRIRRRAAAAELPKSGASDRGLYIIWLQLEAPVRVKVGALGEIDFKPGTYAYVGSAQRNRWARVRRHLRVDKPLRWHFDYLRPHGTVLGASFAAGDREGECLLAGRLRTATGAAVAYPRFGASDCQCPGHLLYASLAPDFVALDASLDTSTQSADQLSLD